MESIGARIKSLRVKKGLSHQKLANAVGVSKTSIIYWERNETLPKHDSLIALAKALETTFDFILTGGDNLDPQHVAAINAMSAEALKLHVESLLKTITEVRDFEYVVTDSGRVKAQSYEEIIEATERFLVLIRTIKAKKDQKSTN